MRSIILVPLLFGADDQRTRGSQDELAEKPPAGLIAAFRETSRNPAIETVRIEPAIALSLESGESPHPRLDGQAWSVHWYGQIQIHRGGKYRLSAVVTGKLRVAIDHREVLAVSGQPDPDELLAGSEFELQPGMHGIEAEFAKSEGRARVRLFWESPHFSREPLPWMALSHRPADEPPTLQQSRLHDRGRFLAEELSCVACHRPASDDAMAKGLAKRLGPDLSRVGERVYARWLFRWLENPQAFRAQAVMPQMFADDETGTLERYSVTCYLASLGVPLQPPKKELDPNDLKNSRKRGERLFGRVGCTVCHTAPEGKKPFAELARMETKTTPEKLAQYLENPLAIDPSGRMPHLSLDGGEARDLGQFLCETFDESLSRALPEPPATDAVLAAFAKIGPSAKETESFGKLSPVGRLIALGKRFVVTKGCTNCHRIAPGNEPLPVSDFAPPFAALRNPKRLTNGCLRQSAPAGSATSSAPRFGLTAEHRESLGAFLAEASSGAGSPAPIFEAQVALRRFHCVGCHSREGQGGLSPELVEGLRKFEYAQDAETIHPPPLSEVGVKLRTPWLRDVLLGGRRARPWMGLRMPQFGLANVGQLPEQLAAADGVAPSDAVKQFAYDAEHVEAGRFLVGKKGFGCISCHDIAGRPNTGTRGPDLASMNQRVQYDWYKRWLDDPQRMQPATRMPTVFPNGTSTIKGQLGGSGLAQSDAIWEYLSLGANLPLPEGLEPPKGLVLAAKERPILIRTFMPDTSSRAFAIGFPNGVSFSFDSARCRLAYGWTGGFLEAGPIWSNRGGSPANVQGPRFWNSPDVFPWSFSDSPGSPPPNWSQQQADPAFGAALPEGQLFEGAARLHFKDYTLSKDGRPAFRYMIDVPRDGPSPDSVEVRERFEPRQELAGVGIVRNFEIRAPSPLTTWLLLAQTGEAPRMLDDQGNSITWDSSQGFSEPAARGRHILVAQGPSGVQILSILSAPDESHWSLRRAGDQWQVMLRLPLAREQSTKLSVGMASPYRNESAMIRALLETNRQP